MPNTKGFRARQISPYAEDAAASVESGAFTAEATAKVRDEDPLPEEASVGNTRESSDSDFGADVFASGDEAASTELP